MVMSSKRLELSRRGAIRGMVAGSFATLAVTATGLAHGTPRAVDAATPNLYELSGDDARISFSASSESGRPTFTFSGLDVELSAEGNDIQITPVVIGGWSFGSLISVYVDAAPDAWARTITLALPDINLTGGDETAFTTFAVVTTHHTNIGGTDYVEGQLQDYEIISLEGTASAVMF